MAQNASSSKPKRVWAKQSIYKVPNFLKILNEKAYKPLMVSFGPYHHDDTMKEHKERALSQFLDRKGKTREDCINYMEPIREEAASCYSELEEKWKNEEKFLDMLILDGCFMLEVIKTSFMLEVINTCPGLSIDYCAGDPIFSSHGKLYNFPVIRRDMLLIENQIPFLVLKKLVEFRSESPRQGIVMAFDGCPGGVTAQVNDLLSEIVMASDTSEGGVPQQVLFIAWERARDQLGMDWLSIPLRAYSPVGVRALMAIPKTGLQKRKHDILETLILQFFGLSKSNTHVGNYLHVLDIYRQGLLQKSSRPTTRPMTGISYGSLQPTQAVSMSPIRCAEQLHEAGIEFQKSSSNYLDKISFNHGILTLPVLEVDDETESKFLNLVAFERLHVDAGNNVTSYVFFMDNLINSANDVSLLSEKSIVESIIGSDEDVAKIFNKLSNELTINPDNSLREVREKIRNHCQHRRNKWRANLCHNYFKSPWTIISLLIAFVYLVLAVVQTTFAIKDFYKPDDKSPSP